MNVMLIDDDPDVRNLFQMIMNHYQHDYNIAESGESGLAQLAANPSNPDIVLMDIFLPDIDGYKALSKIRQAGLIPEACIIATTAYYTNDTPQEVLSRGFDGFIPKPFQTANLVSNLEAILNGK